MIWAPEESEYLPDIFLMSEKETQTEQVVPRTL